MPTAETPLVVQATPLAQDDLAYRVTLAGRWQAQDIEVSVKSLQVDRAIPLGIFQRLPAGPDAVLSIAAMRLSRPVTAADWLKSYATTHGHSLVDLNPEFDGGALGQSTFDLNGRAQHCILRVLLDGDRLFFIQAFATSAAFESLALQGMVESFELANPTGPPNPPSLTAICGKASFGLPGLWLVRPLASPQPRAAATDFFASYVTGAVNCWVRVKFRQTRVAPELDRDMNALGQDLRDADLVFAKSLRQETIKPGQGFLDGGLYRVLAGFPRSHPENAMEATCIALASGHAAVAAYFVFPAESHDGLGWAQGRHSVSAFLATLNVAP